ncbi:MAG: N-acetylmuramoyl-L-alanine amidase [Lachnospiraceae bacterium]|nr:N-acetylmuramoyl-L-alanine amidase [Lachnospiraceae bacterium]
MDGKRKKHGSISTGALAFIVVALAVLLVFLVTGYRQMSKEQQTGSDAEMSASVETEWESDSEKLSETETESELTTETETAEDETMIIIGGEADTEEDTVDDTAEDTETESLVVAIDPGHQGSWVDMSDTEPVGPGSTEMKTKSSVGTQGRYSGVPEYELNLELSLLLRAELETRGYEVVLTREDNDTAISNAERTTYAYEQGGDIYVRIHANGSEDSSVNGALAMVPSASNPYVGDLAEDSWLLADCILGAYCSTAGFESLGIQYYDNMTGINWSKIPVMILEMGFMTNESDDMRMQDDSVQALMVEGIADGIDDYFIQKGMKTATALSETENSAAFESATEESVIKESSTEGSEKEESKTKESETAEFETDVSGDSSSEVAERVNALIEMLGEGYIYPSMDQGEAWAVSVEALDSGCTSDINGDVQMKSASVIKVFIMATIYDRVYYPDSEARRISMDVSGEDELEELISQMITVSDNDAANTLVTMLGQGDSQAGMDVVNQFLAENGYTGTSMGRLFLETNPSGDNYTTANDCRALLASIYNGTCVGENASDAMYEYLKNQTRTGKIPSGLTDTTAVVANKTGELAGDYGDYVENDIAIVEDGEQAYVLCILSNDLLDNSAAVGQMIQMSALAYDMLIVE